MWVGVAVCRFLLLTIEEVKAHFYGAQKTKSSRVFPVKLVAANKATINSHLYLYIIIEINYYMEICHLNMKSHDFSLDFPRAIVQSTSLFISEAVTR